MRYCFIIANSRLDYFNLVNVKAEMSVETGFILITDRQGTANIERSFKSSLYTRHVLDEINYNDCRDILNLYLKNNDNRHCIVCTNEKLLMICARLREIFKIHGAKPYQYIPYISKRQMKQVVSRAGVSVPDFIDFDGINSCRNLTEYHSFIYSTLGPYVIKPLDGGGSEDTVIVKEYKDIEYWYKTSFKQNEEYTAERYIKGTFYLCDSFIYNGEIKFAEVSRYLSPNLDFTKGLPLGGYPLRDNSLKNKALTLNEKVIKAMHTPDGAAHMEFFEENGNLVFIEIGARPPGKSVVNCHKLNFGINLYELTLRYELGLYLNFTGDVNLFHGWVCMPKIPGIVKKIEKPKLNSELSINWNIKVGEEIRHLPSSLKEGTAADIMCYNKNLQELISDMESLKNYKLYS